MYDKVGLETSKEIDLSRDHFLNFALCVERKKHPLNTLLEPLWFRSGKMIVTGAQPVAGAAVNCAIGAGCTSTVVVAVSLQPKEELAIRTGWNKVSAKPLCEYRCAGFVEALPPPSPKVQR